MFKIWAKIIKNDKIISSFMYVGYHFNQKELINYLMEICYNLEIPTPIVLEKHINHFSNFKNTSFTGDDFIESIDFDKLVLENATE